MIQYELFLKEVSDFLRSCTIKNKYYAQTTVNKILNKYGWSSVPDHFNPYYLHMYGLSTLDLVIPDYLFDSDGNKISNSDRKYKAITEASSDHTQLLLTRLESTAVGSKISTGIQLIENNIGLAYLNYLNYTDEINSSVQIWRMDETDKKVSFLQKKMEEFGSNNDHALVNLITGNLNWNDFAKNSPVYSSASSVVSVNSINTKIPSPTNGQYVHCSTEQKTFQFNGSEWVRISVRSMLSATIAYYRSQYNISTATLEIVTSAVPPTIECLVVMGDLNWDLMYAAYSSMQSLDNVVHNGQVRGSILDTDFNDINSFLGYTDLNPAAVGTRVNFLRNARAWTSGSSTVYTKKVITNTDTTTNVYADTSFASIIGVVSSLTGTGDNTFITVETGSVQKEYKRSVSNDVTISHKTYEFNGSEWREVSLRTLFDTEWKRAWKASSLNDYSDLSYTTMLSPRDTDSFSEKLLWKNNTVAVSGITILSLDRSTYTSWDQPIYIPTYDHRNSLTDDFTLYTRFYNNLREHHVRTSLKYFIGASVYSTVCDENLDLLDYIRGVLYPIINCASLQLDWYYITDDNGVQVKAASQTDYDAYIASLDSYLAKAIDADNYTLLRYDSTLLKDGEVETLVDCLRRTLTLIRSRWDVKEFGYEELYYAAVWDAIWNHLLLELLGQRVKNLRTEAVHNDQIWEFLISRGLDNYQNVLDDSQQLFLYKNIDYLIGNEGKRKTLKILSDNLLQRFGAEVRGKSLLLDTTEMRSKSVPDDSATGVHRINELTESVSGELSVLSEDLDAESSVISDVTGRIESFSDVFVREYNSGLEPKYGDTVAEQQQRVSEDHDAIEIKKNSYVPTKLVEITRGSVMDDLAQLSAAFIFQTLARKISGSEILPDCVINCQFEGLSEPKSFTIGEAIALIFYAYRKQMWYRFFTKTGTQIVADRSTLWQHITDEAERANLINNLYLYSTCPKADDAEYVSACDHSFYIDNETFNGNIPSKVSLWLPYLGNYTKTVNDVQITVERDLPKTESGLKALIGNPLIYLRGENIQELAASQYLENVLCPYENTSITLQSWNTMCDAEKAKTVPEKYDVVQDKILTEANKFTKVTSVLADGSASDGTLIGGLISGSSLISTDNMYIEGVPYPETVISNHTNLINFLNDQAAIMIRHSILLRNSCDYYFHEAMRLIYEAIRIVDVADITLVEGFTTFSEWFDSDVELKSAFRGIEEGSDQVSVYGSIADALTSALFPEDKMSVNGNIDLTKYNAIKKLFQQMCSYNIAFLDTSSTSYTTIYTQPLTINCRRSLGTNTVYRFLSNTKTFYSTGYGLSKIERIHDARYVSGSGTTKVPLIKTLARTWNSNSYLFTPTADLTFQDGKDYYIQSFTDYEKTEVEVGALVPFNNVESLSQNSHTYAVFGDDKDSTIYYERTLTDSSSETF